MKHGRMVQQRSFALTILFCYLFIVEEVHVDNVHKNDLRIGHRNHFRIERKIRAKPLLPDKDNEEEVSHQEKALNTYEIERKGRLECERLNACRNGGECVGSSRGHLKFRCLCPLGYSGTYCTDRLPECDSGPCKDKGDCVATPRGYVCVCKNGLQGKKYECKINHSPSEDQEVRLVMKKSNFETAEILLGSFGILVLAISLILALHCYRVNRTRNRLRDELKKQIEQGNRITSLPPGILEVSNQICRQSLCCDAPIDDSGINTEGEILNLQRTGSISTELQPLVGRDASRSESVRVKSLDQLPSRASRVHSRSDSEKIVIREKPSVRSQRPHTPFPNSSSYTRERPRAHSYHSYRSQPVFPTHTSPSRRASRLTELDPQGIGMRSQSRHLPQSLPVLSQNKRSSIDHNNYPSFKSRTSRVDDLCLREGYDKGPVDESATDSSIQDMQIDEQYVDEASCSENEHIMLQQRITPAKCQQSHMDDVNQSVNGNGTASQRKLNKGKSSPEVLIHGRSGHSLSPSRKSLNEKQMSRQSIRELSPSFYKRDEQHSEFVDDINATHGSETVQQMYNSNSLCADSQTRDFHRNRMSCNSTRLCQSPHAINNLEHFHIDKPCNKQKRQLMIPASPEYKLDGHLSSTPHAMNDHGRAVRMTHHSSHPREQYVQSNVLCCDNRSMKEINDY